MLMGSSLKKRKKTNLSKYTSFREIPKLTRTGSYAVDIPLYKVPEWVKEEQEEAGLELNPEFQREHVWSRKQQTAYG